MTVSVIIPVYNAERYLREAVESALEQPQVSEVLLIEDDSPDNALALCEEFASRHDRVRLLRHPGGANRGAAASRNLGILKARNEFVAFLDADDYYLPGRFDRSLRLLLDDSDVDGVYEATAVHFENESLRKNWLVRGVPLMYSFERPVPANRLVETLIMKRGVFTTDAILVRKSIFIKCGLFDEDLRLFQDVIMWHKMAAVGNLVAGRLDEPVAVRRIHSGNRAGLVHTPYHLENHALAWKRLWEWCTGKGVHPRDRRLFLEKYLLSEVRRFRDQPVVYRHVRSIIHYLLLLATERRSVNLSLSEALWGFYLLSGARGLVRRVGLSKLFSAREVNGGAQESRF